MLKAILAVGLLAVMATPSVAGDAMFRSDAGHSGVYPSSPVPTLQHLRWKFQTGAKVLSSPTVSNDTVYFGSADHFVYALAATDGHLKWKFETQGAVNGSPALSANRIFVASLDGFIYALDSATGQLLWKFATRGERRFTAPGIHGATPRTELMVDPFDVFLSSPAVSDGTVYVGSGDHAVYALEAGSGRLRWKFITANVVHASPAVANGVVYVGSWDRNLYALEARGGKVIWRFQTGDDRGIYNQVGIASSVAVGNGIVYFGCRDGHFYAVNARDGTKRWDHDNHKGWVIASPAISGGVVYFPTSDGERFKALDANTGRTIFDRSIKVVSFSSPAIVSDTIFFGTSDGWMHAIDRLTGESRADFQTDGSREHAVQYLDDKGAMKYELIYPDFTLDGMILGLERTFSMGSVLSSPAVADGVIYFGSTDGGLYALD
jgi:outer membrane protein assembly factor BamB